MSLNLSPDAALAALAGLAAVGGLVLAAAGLIGWARPEQIRRRSRTQQRLRVALGHDAGTSPHAWWAQRRPVALAALGVGLAVWLLTSWPLGGLVAAVAVVGLPWMLHPGAGAQAQIQRLEALEEWVRRMSDIHTVGVSLEQAVHSSLRTVPEPIAAQVTRLVSRLSAGWSPTDAYRAFADELHDATADKVVALLVLHVQDRGAGLSRALKDLAAAVSDEVLMRREVEADREKPRTNARWVTLFCLIVFGASMLSDAYVQPYSTWFGQLLLIGLVIGFVVVLLWMRRMANVTPAPRFLSPADRAGTNAPVEGP